MDANNDAKLIALRESIESYLASDGEFWDESETMAANNLTLWAQTFMRITDQQAQEAADRLKQQGANDFVERVRRAAQNVVDYVPSVDMDYTLAKAFTVEVMRLEGVDNLTDNGGR